MEQLPAKPEGKTPGLDTLNSGGLCRCWAEGGDLGDEEEWKQVLAQHCRAPPSLLASPSQVPLHNRFEALELERLVGEDEVKSTQENA